MPNHFLPLFTFSSLTIPPAEPGPSRAASSASRRLRRLLAAASANEVPDSAERALVLDLHAHLRRLPQAK
jgi:hypothetical protein